MDCVRCEVPGELYTSLDNAQNDRPTQRNIDAIYRPLTFGINFEQSVYVGSVLYINSPICLHGFWKKIVKLVVRIKGFAQDCKTFTMATLHLYFPTLCSSFVFEHHHRLNYIFHAKVETQMHAICKFINILLHMHERHGIDKISVTACTVGYMHGCITRWLRFIYIFLNWEICALLSNGWFGPSALLNFSYSLVVWLASLHNTAWAWQTIPYTIG